MKKLTLSLLLSTIMVIKLHSGSDPIITNLGPLQLITPTGSNIFANGTVNICGNIKIGTSSTDTITLQGSGITLPSGNNTSLLVVNNNGNINTASNSSNITFGNISTNNINTIGAISSNNIMCGSLTAGKNIGDTIVLGNNAGTITIISSGIIPPSSGSLSSLMIDSNGNINSSNQTTPMIFGDLTVSSIVNSGSTSCTSLTTSTINASGTIQCGSLTAGGATGQTITLGNPTGAININASNILKPSSGNYNLLSIDDNNNINTATSSTPISVGTINSSDIISSGTISSNSLNTNNINASVSLSCGSLIAARSTGQSVILGNNTGIITLASSNIMLPSAGDYSLLMIDSNGNINSANSATAITIGNIQANNLVLNSNISCDQLNASTINTNNSITCGSLIAANNTGQTITLGNNTGTIKLISFNIINPNEGDYNLLTIDMLGNINTANNSTPINIGDIFTSGITSTGNINCNILNSSSILSTGTVTCGSLIAANGTGQSVNLGSSTGSISIAGSAILTPGSGSAPLYINQNGLITTNASSRNYKNNIQILNIKSTIVDQIKPVSFYYNNDATKHKEFGLIAEDLLTLESLKDTVILDKDGNPIGINYQAISMMIAADYLKMKKEVKQEIKKLKNDIYILMNEIKKLKEK